MSDNNEAGEPVVVRLRHLARYLSQFPDDAVVVGSAEEAQRHGEGAYVDLGVALAHVRKEVARSRGGK